MLLLAEDIDGDDDPDCGLARGKVANNHEQELVVGSQIEVKVCYYCCVCYINLFL